MKYMLLLYADEAAFGRMSPKEQSEGMAAYQAYTTALTKAGALVASNRLRPVTAATTVRASAFPMSPSCSPRATPKMPSFMAGGWTRASIS